MTTFRSKAIVLRRTNYGEADRILHLLTNDHGKINVIARGVRREKSKLKGAIELFGVSDVTIHTGRGELGILTTARLDVFYGHIIEEYDRLQFGYEAMKQIEKVTETVSEPAFFQLLETCFKSLDNLNILVEVTETWFWLQLAILLGMGLNLSVDNEGAKLTSGSNYNYDSESGSLRVAVNGKFSTEHIKLLRLLSAQSPYVANKVKNIEQLLPDCLWLARRIVAH